MDTKVVITIDTESDNLWDSGLRKNPRFNNIFEIPRLQKIFDKYSVKPTYLITFSVAKNDAAGVLKEIARSRKCEIGSHLHSWETPPFERQARGDGTYLHQYPYKVQREKFSNLDSVLKNVFGDKPVSYRGGRYSFDKNIISILAEYGYLVDTSVTPGISWENDGGVNFKKFGRKDHVIKTQGSGILEVPVSIKIKSLLPQISKAVYLNTPNWTHAEGMLRRLAKFDIIWLDPSFNEYGKMRWACDSLLSEGVRHLNIMFHSSVIIPGGSPYTMDKASTDKFFENIERLLEYVVRSKKLEVLTLKEFHGYRSNRTGSL